MKPCAVGSLIGSSVVAFVLAVGACRGAPPPADVPPVTAASATATVPVISGPATDATISVSSPAPIEAGAGEALSPNEPPVHARFVDLPAKLDEAPCMRVLVALVRGRLSVGAETLAPGDVLVLTSPQADELKGSGLVVEAKIAVGEPCTEKARPPAARHVVRGNAAPRLEWAGGKMAAHPDVRAKVSPELYIGRLEGTATVPEHTHPASWEILAVVEANGTLTIDGKDTHVGPRHVAVIPAAAKHAWKPAPGSKLVAVQMYAPPGPEERFVALAAAEKDAGAADGGKR